MNRISDIATASWPVHEEHEAIVTVIRAETQAFLEADFASWSECWVHDARTQDVYVSATAGLSAISGWPAVASHMKGVFQNELGCQLAQFRRVSVLLCMTDLAHASKLKEHDDNDDFQGTTGRAA